MSTSDPIIAVREGDIVNSVVVTKLLDPLWRLTLVLEVSTNGSATRIQNITAGVDKFKAIQLGQLIGASVTAIDIRSPNVIVSFSTGLEISVGLTYNGEGEDYTDLIY